MSANRNLLPFFAPKNIVVVGTGERATTLGSAVMQMLRQSRYGEHVVPVNPKGGTTFGFQLVTAVSAIEPSKPRWLTPPPRMM
jgi:acetyltransferase